MAKTVPLIPLTLGNLKMLAKYHANSGSPETELRCLRIALVHLSISAYNDGHFTETDMHGVFDLAFSDNADNLRLKGYELLKGC